MAESDWHPDGLDMFFKSEYTYDDASKLAKLWDIPVVEAKQVLGHKIIHNIENLLPADIQRFENGHYWLNDNFQAYLKSDYDYEDAELLASLWDMTILGAKNEIGYKVLNGLERNLPDKLRDNDKVEDHTNWDDKALTAYGKSAYTYDDAELLAQLWGIAVIEAKKTIGYKIIEDIEKFLPDKVRRENKVNPDDKALDAFFKSDYTYDDAELLAQLWGISVFEAKKTIGYKIVDDVEKFLPDKIRRESKVNPDDKALDAFFKSDYTYDDAELLAQLWGISVFEAKKTIGFKIVEGIEKFLPDKVRRDHSISDEAKAVDAFFKSDYSYSDAELLAQLWGISVYEAKKTIGYKIIEGIEHLLPDKVRPPEGC